MNGTSERCGKEGLVGLQRKSESQSAPAPDGGRNAMRGSKTAPDARWASLHPLLLGLQVSPTGPCLTRDRPQDDPILTPSLRAKQGMASPFS